MTNGIGKYKFLLFFISFFILINCIIVTLASQTKRAILSDSYFILQIIIVCFTSLKKAQGMTTGRSAIDRSSHV